jgi:hypothetical protein
MNVTALSPTCAPRASAKGQRVFIRADLNVPQDELRRHHRRHPHPRQRAGDPAWRWTPAPP